MSSQSTSNILMIRPATFGFDTQTAKTNTFQYRISAKKQVIAQQARAEFDNLVKKLESNDIEVLVLNDSPKPPKPNAVFPNNWLSTWPDGRVFLYPMATPSRRVERNQDYINVLKEKFYINELVDISDHELNSVFLESTGVLVFDHANKIAYGCVSSRCNKALFIEHCATLDYRPFLFRAADVNGAEIYHTNIVLAVQSKTAVVCLEAIVGNQKRAELSRILSGTGHKVIDINQQQMANYCANVLEVKNKLGKSFLILSKAAHQNFTDSQKNILSKDKELLFADLATIERVGGGSARCMMAEIFLPPKSNLIQ